MFNKDTFLSIVHLFDRYNDRKIYIGIVATIIVAIQISTYLYQLINNIDTTIFEYRIINDLNFTIKIALIIIYIILFLTLNIIINQFVEEYMYDIAILKSIGYKKSHLLKIFKYKSFSLVTISYIISFFISQPFFLYIKYTINNKFEICNIEANNMINYFIILIFCYSITMINTYTIICRINKISIKSLLNK